ncbi:MAG: S41 family peptidase [Bryobacteraceae bacterium]
MTTNSWLVRRRATNRSVSALWALLLAGSPLWAAVQAPSSTSSETDRLVAVAKTWVTVKYFHPFLADRTIDWDKALVDALPRIHSARDVADYRSAVATMLSVLQDPLTRVLSLGEKADVPAEVAPQRTRIHYGLPPHTNGWRGFYSGVVERSAAPVSVMSQPLGSDLTASIRLSEPTAKGAASAALVAHDRDYSEATFPSPELRVLAAYRLWGAVHYFFGYKDLMDEDWDAAFGRLLPKFLAARDALEYNLAVSELVKTLADSHATVESAELKRYFGESPLGLRIRLIDRKPVITDVLDDEAKQKGVRVGDLLTKLDGEALPERVRREASYISGSTQQGLGVLVCQKVLNGSEGSSVSVTTTSPDGTDKEVTLKRSARYASELVSQRKGEVVRILPGNIGYMDLDRVEDDAVNAAFDRLRDTVGIVFDLRGRFRANVRSFASRITSKTNVTGMIVNGPVLLEPDAPHTGSDSYSASYLSSTVIPSSDLPKYKGKIVALVDERTADSSELAALFLEAAAKTEFVGSPSAGVVGESTDLALPGGILVSFSGQDVRHANGGPVQRLGIQPSVSAAPTMHGIREGRDEALEKALELFTNQ